MSYPTQQLADQLISDDPTKIWKRRQALSKAITLAESRAPDKQQEAAYLLTHLLEHKNRPSSFRLGIAGAPGAGKSTFIECFGKYLLGLREDNATKKTSNDATNTTDSSLWTPSQLAVVCVDPSSVATGGSILGDKTRMTELSRHSRAYVRPAPAAGALGGLAAYTDDVVRLCQTAGYDLVLVETVGLGQSEIEVAESVDMLLLLVPPGGGDDLQGVKKGIIEVADMLLVTKADGSLMSTAKHTAADYRGAMQFVRTTGRPEGWERPPVLMVSSVTGDGVAKVWEHVCRYRQEMMESGLLYAKRRKQGRYWMWRNFQNLVQERTKNDPDLKQLALELQERLDSGRMTPRVAAKDLLESLVSKA